MSRDLRKRMKQLRETEVQRLAERLLSDPGEDVSDCVHRVRTYGELIDVMPIGRWRQRMFFGFAVLCIGLIGLAWSLPMWKKARVILNVDASAIEVTSTGAVALKSSVPLSPAHLVRLEELTRLSLPVPGPMIEQLEGRPWVHISGGQLSLTRLELEKSGALRIETEGSGRVRIFAIRGDFTGELELAEAKHISAGSHSHLTRFSGSLPILEPPETVVFSARSTEVAPAWLQIHPGKDLVFEQLHVKGLKFFTKLPVAPGPTTFLSTVLKGTLRLADTGKVVELQKGDFLSLPQLEGTVVEMRVGDQIQSRFEGRAERVYVGPEGFQTDLTPTILEYLHHNERWALFAGAVSLVWGLLWSVRRLWLA